MDLNGQYPAFANANLFETSEKGKRRRSDAELREMFRKKLWDEKLIFALNQWVTQMLRVKPHLEILEGQH